MEEHPMTRRSRTLVLMLALAAVVGSVADAVAQSWGSVSLSWTAPGDDSLSGTASQYDLRYSTSPINASNFAAAQPVTGMPAPAAPGTTQRHTVTGLAPSTQYWFALKTADEVPNWAGISNIINVTTASAPDTIRPARVTTLAVAAVTDTTAQLTWTAVGDDSLAGTASSYEIRYSTSPITAGNFSASSAVNVVPTPGAPGSAQAATARGLSRQTTYYFALVVRDEAGNPSALSNVPSATTPDTTAPASVRNLAVGFVGFGWITADAMASRVHGVRP
jgi:chitodextrinase